ncbi:phosphoketolase [Acidicapsa dinghuensis]|uniref:Probable phosphoketolase n=1 Tax=Acidicapsa dinghuensis TaxID=2218256 RepID=A0ABW1EDE6_9BACT|nr:phosphoketolase family protein [Acidicapsa dinghuensis]
MTNETNSNVEVPTQAPRQLLSPELLNKMDAYWRAANYLSVGQIYLKDNPLLRKPLTLDDVKPRLLGHWGTTPGLNFIYVHLNRAICERNLNMMYIIGPGHGGPGIVANTYLEGSYTELYPAVEQNADGIKRLFRQFSWPLGIPSHVAPETPGSIHEGGELGYSLVHAYGAALDNPDLIVTCIVGDGESETGPLATSWHSNKFLNPATDGAVLPILHLNGYKIANPTILARIPHAELEDLMRGYGYEPFTLEGHEPHTMHEQMAQVLDTMLDRIAAIQKAAREEGNTERPRWPMLIFKTPKGWTGPKTVDGKPVEGTWRAHQVPFAELFEKPDHLRLLEEWMRSYKPQELFDEKGRFQTEFADIAPKGRHRMGMNPHANGGLLLKPLVVPSFRDFKVPVNPTSRGDKLIESTRVLGELLHSTMEANLAEKNFRVFGPDETASNRLQAVEEGVGKAWMAETLPVDELLSPTGRVMEVLSEHLCQGWLEGYLLTGRHGFFSCYEAFIHIVDSMVNQHAKWLKVTREIPWRKPIASLNYLLSSHVWRQDHNGFSHQDPGFIDHLLNKKSDIVRIYLPPDANTLLSVADHCLRSRNYINLIVAGKQPEPQWLTMDEAVQHCIAGLGIWNWASDEGEPDVVMACCGDVPTQETLAAAMQLRADVPGIKVRVVNVVDLMTLQPSSEHPHGLSDEEFDLAFTTDKPIIFAFHGYPWGIHSLTYRRHGHDNIHVRGYKEEGTTTTPFDMCVRNNIDRYQLTLDAIKRIPRLAATAENASETYYERIQKHRLYVAEYGEDLPEIRDWKWSFR